MACLSTVQEIGFTVLSEGVEPNVDLIFVHGQGGGPQSTWEFGEVFWPRDFLPQRFPNFRILTYGYDTSSVRSKKVRSNIEVYAYGLIWCLEEYRSKKKTTSIRPVIFLCHGIGGLVARKAILLLQAEQQFIFTGGFILLGILQEAIEMFSEGVLDHLEYIPDDTYQTSCQFARQTDPNYIKIVDAIEKMGSKAKDKRIVARESEMRLYESDHKTLKLLNELTQTYKNRGLWEEAEAAQMQMTALCKRVLGEDNPDTLASMDNLASIYSSQELWGKAEKLEKQVLEARMRVLGICHRHTLTSMANLACTYADQGRLSEAEELEEQVFEISARELGENHPDTLASMANLACTYINRGRWVEAEELEVRVLEARVRLLGVHHRHTLTSIANLASTYSNQGLWDEAEELQVQLSGAMTDMLGEDHPDTLASMANLASIYLSQGRWEEARKLEVRVLEARRRVLGDGHRHTLTSMANLACTYIDRKRWEEAERLQVLVLETMTKVLSEDHPDTLTSMGNLASTYSSQKRWKEAEELEERVLKASTRVLGQDHSDTLTSVKNLASIYLNEGRWGEAEKLQLRELEARIRRGDDYYYILTLMSRFVSTYIHMDRLRPDEARNLEEQILEASRGPSSKNNLNKIMSIVRMSHMDDSSRREDQFSEAWSQAEDIIAQAFASNWYIAFTILEALDKTSPRTVDQQMLCAVRDFSKDVQLLATETLHKNSSTILQKRATAIAVKIRRFAAAKKSGGIPNSSGHQTNLEVGKLLEQSVRKEASDRPFELIFDTYASEGSESLSELENSDNSCESSELDAVRDFTEPDNSNELALLELAKDAHAIEQVSRYLTSKTLLSLFSLAVGNNFCLLSQSDKQLEHSNQTKTDRGELNPSQQTIKDISDTTPCEDQSEKHISAGHGSDHMADGSSLLPIPLKMDELNNNIEPKSPNKWDSLEGVMEEATKLEYTRKRNTKKIKALVRKGPISRDIAVLPTSLTDDTYLWPEIFADGKTNISFENEHRLTLPNEIKGWIEDFLDIPISWWPLSPRRKRLREGFTRVNWKCRCGRKLSGVISIIRMNEYQQWLTAHGGTSSSPNSGEKSTVTHYSVANATGQTNNITPQDHPPESRIGHPGNSPTTAETQMSTGDGTTIGHKFLLWCVNSRPMRTHLKNVHVTATDNDAIVFQKLKTEYYSIRGWRRFFSLYVISEIRFVKFRCYRLNHVGCYLKQQLPKHDDPNYDYEPRDKEPEDVPPLPVEELMEYFEDPSCAGTSANTLRYFPKKLNGKMLHQVGDGVGWGLHAREYLSILKISILGLLILVGTFLFVPFWLQRHPGDLQNAFIPPFFFLALAGVCIVLPQVQQPAGANSK